MISSQTLIGDYLLQNDFMAANKKKMNFKGWLACTLHCLIYSLPFLLIATTFQAFLIFLSHFLIDKFGLAEYWVRFINWEWASNNFGYAESKPTWMSVWLLIIVDNTFHLACNYLIIKFV